MSLGAKVLKQKAVAGDREAQFSHGFSLIAKASGFDGSLKARFGSSPDTVVGLAVCVFGRLPDCIVCGT